MLARMTTGINKCGTPPTYSEFLQSYLTPNRPLLIGRDLVQGWTAFQLWEIREQERHTAQESENDSHSIVDWDHLSSEYGSLLVNVTDCARSLDDLCTVEMHFKDVVDMWHHRPDNATTTTQLLYVKDWHLPRLVSAQAHQSPPFYTTPSIFADDWLNYHYSTFTEDDFRFVYIGVQGTFTPFHKDVYDSYSWSTNIVGRKLWTFWLPGDADRTGNGLEVVQEAGETMFVPSGWYHTVQNLTTCISINHNWCNSVNLPSIYDAICRRIVDVERELDDVKHLLSSNAHERKEEDPSWENEWMNIVQDVLEKDAGWNWSTFWPMVLHGLEAAIRSQDPAHVVGTMLFPPASRDLQPPLSYVKQNVRYCFDKFCTRQKEELKGEYDLPLKHCPETEKPGFLTLKSVVVNVGEMLNSK